jgi:hypothetical protein
MPGIFSGNGSVAWVVEGTNVREASTTLSRPERGAPRRVRHSGTVETDPDQDFTIAIKVPHDERDADRFIDELKKRAATLKRGDTLELTLPIEDQRRNRSRKATENQIVISWPSATKAEYAV